MRVFYLIFAAACLLCSCAKDAVTAPEKTVTLAIEVSDDTTRTFVEGDKIYWSQSGDKLGIVYFADQNSASRKFTGTNDEYVVSENSASFTADFTATEGASGYTFGAFYPYEYKYVSNNSITLTVPQSQTPTESSFDPVADILISKEPVTVEGTPSVVNFTFSRLVALVNMTIKGIPAGEKIESVTFSSPAKPAGSMSVVLHTAGTLENAQFYNNYEDITLNLNGRVATGEESLWFTAMPTELSGSAFTVTVVTDKNDYTKTVDLTGKTLTFERANIARFSVSDLKVAEKPVVYNLLTDASQLTVGDKIVIANKKIDTGVAKALSTSSYSTNKISPTANFAISVGPQILPENLPSDTAVFTVEQGATADTFAFKSDAGYLYCEYTDSPWVREFGFQEAVDDCASWTVTLNSSNVAQILGSVSGGRYLRCDTSSSGSNRYDVYTSALNIYIYYIDGEPVEAPAEESYVFELNFPLEGAASGATLSTVKVNDYISLYSADASWRVNLTDGWDGIFMGSGKSLTFSTNDSESYELTKIELVSRDGYTLSTDKGNGATVTWEGNSSSVSFKASAAARIVSAVVYCKAK